MSSKALLTASSLLASASFRYDLLCSDLRLVDDSPGLSLGLYDLSDRVYSRQVFLSKGSESADFGFSGDRPIKRWGLSLDSLWILFTFPADPSEFVCRFIKLIRFAAGSSSSPGAIRGRGWLVHRGPIGSGDGLQTRLVATRSKHPHWWLTWVRLPPPAPRQDRVRRIHLSDQMQ